MMDDIALSQILWNIRHMMERMEELLSEGNREQAKNRLRDAQHETAVLKLHLAAVQTKFFKERP